MTIKKVFDGIFDDEVHSDFLKFGRGEYKNRFMIEGKTQKDIWSIKTSAEFANFFVRKCLEKVSGKIAVKGVIVCTFDLRAECTFDIKKVGNFQGIRKVEIDTEIDPKEILALMKKFPRVFFALTFKTDKFDLKIKPKAPKSGKPGKATEEGEGEGPKVDFCSLKTADKDLLNELFFGVGLGWKEIRISHTLKINEIIYPKDLKTLKPEQVREQSKRKGIIVRIIEADGKKSVKEANFEA